MSVKSHIKLIFLGQVMAAAVASQQANANGQGQQGSAAVKDIDLKTYASTDLSEPGFAFIERVLVTQLSRKKGHSVTAYGLGKAKSESKDGDKKGKDENKKVAIMETTTPNLIKLLNKFIRLQAAKVFAGECETESPCLPVLACRQLRSLKSSAVQPLPRTFYWNRLTVETNPTRKSMSVINCNSSCHQLMISFGKDTIPPGSPNQGRFSQRRDFTVPFCLLQAATTGRMGNPLVVDRSR